MRRQGTLILLTDNKMRKKSVKLRIYYNNHIDVRGNDYFSKQYIPSTQGMIVIRQTRSCKKIKIKNEKNDKKISVSFQPFLSISKIKTK